MKSLSTKRVTYICFWSIPMVLVPTLTLNTLMIPQKRKIMKLNRSDPINLFFINVIYHHIYQSLYIQIKNTSISQNFPQICSCCPLRRFLNHKAKLLVKLCMLQQSESLVRLVSVISTTEFYFSILDLFYFWTHNFPFYILFNITLNFLKLVS